MRQPRSIGEAKLHDGQKVLAREHIMNGTSVCSACSVSVPAKWRSICIAASSTLKSTIDDSGCEAIGKRRARTVTLGATSHRVKKSRAFDQKPCGETSIRSRALSTITWP